MARGGVADHFAAGQTARYDHGIEVTGSQLVEMAIRHQLHPARGADLARSGGATGGQHHIDATLNQGIDDGNRLYLFRPGPPIPVRSSSTPCLPAALLSASL